MRLNLWISVLVCLTWMAGVAAASTGDDAQMELSQSSGHGNITLEGPTGMFLNPTSGIARSKELIVQYCAAILEAGNDNIIGHNAIVSYGFMDRFELGMVGQILDLDNAGDDTTRSGGGPYARLKILREERLLPEFTVGGILILGDDAVEKDTIFFAASKGLGLRRKGLPFDFRMHAGVRKWRVQVGEDSEVAFFGGEIALPKNIYIVSEVSTEPDGATKTPYSIGMQFRHPEGYGFSLAAIQPGTQDELGIFIGIGVNFN